jgi:hypothetical protein
MALISMIALSHSPATDAYMVWTGDLVFLIVASVVTFNVIPRTIETTTNA